MGIVRVSHVGICVSDLERSLRFYRDLLGFRYRSELRVSGEPSDTLLRLRGVSLHAVYLERDGTRIELLHYESPGHVGEPEPRPMNRLGLTHLSLRVNDLARTLESLRAEGVRILDETLVDIPAARAGAVFVTDPDGTLVELVQSPGDPDKLPGEG
ncbi:MAG: glyoxalase [Candidatus Binatia bacterium]|nr:MAG: glyoxalase [Candidatus Binatia bacterium]